TTPRVIHACVLLTPDGNGNPNPYVLPLISRSALRPAGWSLVNPLAPPHVVNGDAVWTRWATAGHSADANDPARWHSSNTYWADRGLPSGSPLLNAVPPDWPQYWEVVLSDGLGDQLNQFDLIYLAHPAGSDLNITSVLQQAALRRAVENGAVLWVDNAGGPVASFPVPRCSPAPPFTFQTLNGALQSRTAQDPAHPLLCNPFILNGAEISVLGSVGVAPFSYVQQATSSGTYLADVPLTPVVNLVTDAASGPEIMAAPYGQGAIVVTSENVGQQIENWYGTGALQPSPVHAANFKLAYNIVNFAHAWGQAQQGPGQRGHSFVQARAPLDLLWQFPAPWGDATLPSQPGPVAGSPVISAGRLFVLSTIGAANAIPTLWCLSAAPTGVNGYDVLWSVPLNAANGFAGSAISPRATSPTACTINGTPAVLVSAVDTAGNVGYVQAFNAVDGSRMWGGSYLRTLNAYGNGTLVALSTPVVFKNWVFVLATEYDSALPGGGIQGTYGRVHVFDLATGGNTSATPPGTYWVYPDANRNDLQPTPAAENQKLLPAFHNLTWTSDTNRSELPPDGDNRPTVSSALQTPFGLPIEATLLFHAPAQLSWNTPVANQINTLDTNGEQYAFVPTPADGAGAAQLNADYYAARLNFAASSLAAAERHDTPLLALTTPTLRTAPDSASLAWFGNSENAVAYADTVSDTYTNPLLLRQGSNVAIDYVRASDGAPITDEIHFLPGPVAWVRQIPGWGVAEHSGRALAHGTQLTLLDAENGALQAQFSPGAEVPPALATGVPTAASAPAMDAQSALAAVSLYPTSGNPQGAVVGLRTQPDFTIRLGPGLPDSLGVRPGSLSMSLVEPGGALAADQFAVDGVTRLLRLRTDFPSWKVGVSYTIGNLVRGSTAGGLDRCTSAHTSAAANEPGVGATWNTVWQRLTSLPGKALQVTWTDTAGTAHANELHVLPSLTRFTYVGGFLKLRYYPVVTTTVSVAVTAGSTVNNVANGETTAALGGDTVLPNGWLDLRQADVTDAVGVNRSAIGKQVLVSYRGWSEADQSWAEIANPPGPVSAWATGTNYADGTFVHSTAIGGNYYCYQTHTAAAANEPGVGADWRDYWRRNYPAEEQQVPYQVGPSVGGVAFTGQSAVVPARPAAWAVNTAYVLGDFVYSAATGLTYRCLATHTATAGDEPGVGAHWTTYWAQRDETLLSLLWDPVSHLAQGYLSRAAVTLPTLLSPNVTGSPAAFRERVYVGTAQAPAATGGAASLGAVGCLGPRRTLVCDGNRLVEAVGTDRVWTLTGSKAFIWGRTAPEPELSTPFNRPAKASALNDGSYLVVDTGNNRVIQADRAGNQLWPLDRGLDTDQPCDYYSSPARTVTVSGAPVQAGNYNLKLAQPADAYRYTAGGQAHTLIADTGHNRVLHVISSGTPGGAQMHTVTQVTPDFVRPPWDRTRPLKLRYTRAKPIFDFNNANLIGYLCAASNIDRTVIVEAGTGYVNPAPTSTPPGGTRPWSDWSWLYDLQFENLRHIEYFPYGTTVYVAAAAGGLVPNATVWAAGVNYTAGASVFSRADRRLYRCRADHTSTAADEPGVGANATTYWAPLTNQDGVWVWQINTGTGLVQGSGPARSVFAYTTANYAAAGAFSRLVVPATNATGSNLVYPRRFYPVCVKVLYPGLLFGGTVMITNYTGLVENLARPNVGSPGSGLHGEVFEVDPLQPAASQILEGRIIPDPWQADWNDPLNQPAYAERY
ncbi:MAG: hypothetical protein GX100_07095, partial [candidate division WS1 bacterium]|nr:hypothetical protein [candidate division WS1 bacterium]